MEKILSQVGHVNVGRRLRFFTAVAALAHACEHLLRKRLAMDRLDYFFRQLLTEAELDEGFDKVEAGDQAIMADQLLTGVFIGGEVAEHFPTPDLTVDLAGPMNAYDQLGRRIFFSPLQVLDMSVDELSVSTAVATPGNEKILTIFAEFDRNLSDPRLDGNSLTVFFQRAESFKLNVVQSAEAAIGLAVPPAPRADQLILADITLVNAQTQILTADIDSDRRHDVFNITGSPSSIRAGRVQDAIQDILNIANGAVSYAGGGNWADATTNPATTVELQFDKIISDLGGGTGGTAKLSGAASGNPNPILTATDLAAQLTELENEVVDGSDKHGFIWEPADLLGANTNGGWTQLNNVGVVDYWNFGGAATTDEVMINLRMRKGDVLEQVKLVYVTTGGSDLIDISVEKYDQSGTGFVRSVLGTLTNQAGTGLANFLTVIVTGIAHTVDNELDRYRVVVTPSGGGAATRRVYACAFLIGRETA